MMWKVLSDLLQFKLIQATSNLERFPYTSEESRRRTQALHVEYYLSKKNT